MKFYDDGISESWNLAILPGYGDNDPTVIATREFEITGQTEWGYFGAFRKPFQDEVFTEIMAEMFD